MGLAGGTGILKFAAIVFYAIILLGVLSNIISSAIHWNKTGETTPLIESTLGQIVYWDGAIYTSMSVLKDESLNGIIPEDIRVEYKANIAKQILIYIGLFLILGYVLYRLGNWLAGKGQLDATTDITIIIVIIMVFAFSEFLYGYLMDKPNIVPFRGIFTWLTNFDVWWESLSRSQDYAITVIQNQTTVIP